MAAVEAPSVGTPLEERSPNPAPRSPPRRPRNDQDRDDRPRRPAADKYRPERPAKRERTPPPAPTEEQKQAAAKAEYEKLLTARSGGVYIPPARLRALQAQITDKTSKEYQRMAWDALKKSINGLVNKANVANMKHIVPELFNENLIRGRGLFCQSLVKAQAASLPFTPIYASMVAIVNTKIPTIGELLIKRLVSRFRKAFRRNDKQVCLSAATFLAHLTNQQVCHEMVCGQILLLLLKKPTDDSCEIAVALMKEVGHFLSEMNPPMEMVIFDQFRNILHEADIDKRTQYSLEVLFQIRKDKFKDNPAVKEELDLVEEEDQIKHFIELDGDIDTQDTLNIFKFDPNYEENEEAYKKLKAEILGEGSDDEYESDDESSESEEENEEDKAMEIKDQSNADLVNLRRTIYLTIQSSMDPEEAVHKLMKINLPAGQEAELPSMVVECCSQEKTYTKFHGAIGERFAKINRLWTDLFEQSFVKYYETIHRYETNRLRNIARFFGHLLATDAIGWHVLSCVHLNEDETTAASRIFLKILFQDIWESIGLPKLQARMKDEALQPSFQGIFPHDTPRNTRFAINYFTSIGLGAITEEMREFLQNMPKPTLPAAPVVESDSESVSSYSSYTGSSYSSRSRTPSRSRSPRRAIDRRGRSLSRTPPRRGRSYTRSVDSRRSMSDSRSRSPPPRRAAAEGRGRSLSRTPPRRYRDRSYSSRSRSPTRSISAGGSRSPSPRRAVRRGRSASRSVSPTPSRSRTPPARRAPAGRRDSHSSRSPSRSMSRSPSPPPRRRDEAVPPQARGRPDARRAPSYSRSPSPPARRRRRNSSSSLSSAPRKKYRRGS